MLANKSVRANIFLALICALLLIALFVWINYLVKNKYVVECFEQTTSNTNVNNPNYVNIPLTTNYTCHNFCGPSARCSSSGQQCIADTDCPGCSLKLAGTPNPNRCVSGQNDAGKLTFGVTPQYSSLTTDIGTMAAFYKTSAEKRAPQANFGINTWLSPFQQERLMFDKRYMPPQITNMPNYPNQYTVTGILQNNDPLAANAYLS